MYINPNIKKYFYPGYISLLFCREYVEDLIPIIEFIAELESIDAKTTDNTLAMIRLKWWSDNITKVFEEEKAETPLLGKLLYISNIYPINNEDYQKIIELYSKKWDNNASEPKFAIENIFLKIYGYSEMYNQYNSISEAFSIIHRITSVDDRSYIILDLKSLRTLFKKYNIEFLIYLITCYIHILKGNTIDQKLKLITKLLASKILR